MKLKLILTFVVILAVAVAAWYLRYGGVTHEGICNRLDDRSAEIMNTVDDRYMRLDRKLDRIESKLDRLLEIADRPLPDGMQKAK